MGHDDPLRGTRAALIIGLQRGCPRGRETIFVTPEDDARTDGGSGMEAGETASAGSDGVPGGEPTKGGMTRRRFLTAVAAVGGTAAAGVLLWDLVGDDDDDQGKRGQAAKPTLNAAGTKEVRTLHLALGAMGAVPGDAVIQIAGRQYPVTLHTEDSRKDLVKGSATLSAVPADRLSHYVKGLELPTDVAVHLHLMADLDPDGHPKADTKYLGSYVHVPTEAVTAERNQASPAAKVLAAYAADAALRETVAKAVSGAASSADVEAALAARGAGGAGTVGGSPARFGLLGIAANAAPTTPAAAQELDAVVDPTMDTAISLTLHHPDLATKDPQGAARLREIALHSTAVSHFGQTIADIIGNAGADTGATTTAADGTSGPDETFGGSIGVMELCTDPSGNAVHLPATLSDGTSVPQSDLFVMRLLDRDGEYPQLRTAWAAAAADVLAVSKADPLLQDRTWHDHSSPGPKTVEASAPVLQEEGVQFSLAGECTQSHSWGLKATFKDYDAAKDLYTIEISNDYLRHVMMAVQYYDGAGNAIEVSKLDPDSSTMWSGLAFTPFIRSLDLVPSAPTILGVTLPGANKANIELPWPDGADHARVFAFSMAYTSARGTGLDRILTDSGGQVYGDRIAAPQQAIPMIFTLIFDLLMPTFLLLHDVGQLGVSMRDVRFSRVTADDINAEAPLGGELQPVVDTFERVGGEALILLMGLSVTGGAAALSTIPIGNSIGKFVKDMAIEFIHLLLGVKGFEYLVEKLLIWMGGEELVNSVPFFGQMMAALGIMEDAVKLATANIEMAIAPPVQHFTLTPSYDATITVLPDTGDSGWPQAGKYYQLSYRIQNQPTTQIYTGTVDDPSAVANLEIPISKVSVGGLISWSITVLTEPGGWMVGYGETEYVANAPLGKVPKEVTIQLVEQLIPLSDKSSVARGWTTDASSGTVELDTTAGRVVGGTFKDLNPSSGDHVGEVGGVTIATRQGAAGYTWASQGRWFARNLHVREKASDYWSFAGPFDRRPFLAYDTLSSDRVQGQNYLLDPRGLGNGLMVRRVDVTKPGELAVDTSKAFGKFQTDIHAVSYNPLGCLVGLAANARIAILRLAAQPMPDPLVPVADMASGSLPPGLTDPRPGYMTAPALVASRADGTILVLDAAKPSIYAFDITGVPAQVFPDDTGQTGASELVLPDTVGKGAYHGFGVDGGNFLYIVSSSSAGTVDAYRLDVFDVNGNAVFTTTGVNAAAYVVDYWRNGYGVNYELLAGKGGPDRESGAVEPSVSVWNPTTPKP